MWEGSIYQPSKEACTGMTACPSIVYALGGAVFRALCKRRSQSPSRHGSSDVPLLTLTSFGSFKYSALMYVLASGQSTYDLKALICNGQRGAFNETHSKMMLEYVPKAMDGEERPTGEVAVT